MACRDASGLNRGTLILSYDCEGIWGMLDEIESLDQHVFNRQSLLDLYKQLIALHEEFDFAATFAFVGALISTEEEVYSALKQNPNAVSAKKWCKPILKSESKFSNEDIYLPELLDLVVQSPINHEIASHGFSHVIMDNDIDEESLKFEISSIRNLIQKKGLNISTMIFPRNVINQKFVREADFILGYRAAPYSPFRSKILRRIYSLFREFIPFSLSEQLGNHGKAVIIPGSFFVNWRRGVRRYVPIWLTVLRFRVALSHACLRDGIVHIWLHPHNIATGVDQMVLLRKMFALIDQFRKKRGLTIHTQASLISEKSQS